MIIGDQIVTQMDSHNMWNWKLSITALLISYISRSEAFYSQVESTIRFSARSRPRAGAKSPKKLSHTLTAIRKRKSQYDKNVRYAENFRRNMANKLKRKDPVHQERWAALGEARKIAKKRFIGGKYPRISIKAFWLYWWNTWVFWDRKGVINTNHQLWKAPVHKGYVARNSIRDSNINSNLISIDFGNKSSNSARTVTPL